MELHIYAIPSSGENKVERIGKLSTIERGAYRLIEINQETGKLDNEIRTGQFEKLNVSKATRGCLSKFGSFRWTHRCTGCGRQIRGPYQFAIRKYPTIVPNELRQKYIKSEYEKVANDLPDIKNMPEQIQRFFDGVCWIGVPCVENLDPWDNN